MSSLRSIRSIACVFGSLAASHVAVAQTYSSGPVNAPIMDRTLTQSTITVAGSIPFIDTASVRLNIAHSWDADLDVVLIPPQNDAYVHLFSDVGGAGANFQSTVLDASSTIRINAAGEGFVGRFRAEGGGIQWESSYPLPAVALAGMQSLAGRSAEGDWTILVFDDSNANEGTLLDWSLTFGGVGAPIAPRVEIFAQPETIPVDTVCIVSAMVIGGEYPASTNTQVNIDAASIGAGAVIARDDGIAPDVQADDRVFTANVPVGPIAPGAYPIHASVVDAQGRGATDTITLQVTSAPTSDDLCASATLISLLPFVDPGWDVAGNVELTEWPMSCAAGGPSNAVKSRWFGFECVETQYYVITTQLPQTAAWDTVLSIYEGDSCGELMAIACDDDGSGLRSYVRVLLESGKRYFIQAALWSSGINAPNAIALEMRADPAVGACCLVSGCEALTSSECATRGGAYNGDGTVCEPGAGPRVLVSGGVFEDIRSEGDQLSLGDDGSQLIQMPFVAPTPVGDIGALWVSANGFVSTQQPDASFSNRSLSNDAAVTRLCPLWDDLDCSFGTVHHAVRGVAGIDRRMIVQWTDAPQYGSADSGNTFQIVLYEYGAVEYRYGIIDDFSGPDATIGARNQNGSSIVEFAATNLADHLSLRIEDSAGQPLCAACPWPSVGCGADYTGDGAIDGDDVIAFFADWDNAVPCADVDVSGSVDGDDVISFFAWWDAGGC